MLQRRSATISRQLIFPLAVVLSLTVGLGVYTMDQMEKIDAHVQELESTWMPAARLLSEMKAEFFNLRLSEFQIIFASGLQEADGSGQRLRERIAAYRQREDEFVRLIAAPEQRAEFSWLRSKFELYLNTCARIVHFARSKRTAEAMALMTGPSRQLRNEIAGSLDALAGATLEKAAESSRTTTAILLAARKSIATASAIALVTILTLGTMFFRSMVGAAREHAAGAEIAGSVKAIAGTPMNSSLTWVKWHRLATKLDLSHWRAKKIPTDSSQPPGPYST